MSTTTAQHFDIQLTLRGPLLTKASAPSAFGVDAAIARVAFGPDVGKACIPGTHIEGKIRESLLLLGYEVDQLLGKESAEGDNEPSRGCLSISDLVHETQGLDTSAATRNRIAIDSALGSVQHAALQVIESPFAAGAEVIFKGRATCWGGTVRGQDLANQLQVALAFLTHIGAQRGIGFGRVLSASVTPAKTVASTSTSSLSGTDKSTVVTRYSLTLQVHSPLCIARHKIGDNLFESEDFIPGGMITGALMESANKLRHAIDKTLFDQARFLHAHPAPANGTRPSVIPNSYVFAGKQPYDVVQHPRPTLCLSEYGNTQAPAFPGDWKSSQWATASAAHHRHSPARELRVRTAIDYDSRTADRGKNNDGGKLFAWEVVHPFDDGHQPLVWHGILDLSALSNEADRSKLLAQLTPLLSHLGFLSKTKASATGTLTPLSAPIPGKLDPSSPLALVLQSPVLLADPRHQSLPDVPSSGALGAHHMLQLYRAAWAQLSGNTLHLTHHFAQQRLAGGNYLNKRFQKGKAYNPYLLTTPGSVFVFEVRDAATASQHLTHWLAKNLPLPTWAEQAHGTHWSAHPYHPQNGYGEVVVHQANATFPQLPCTD